MTDSKTLKKSISRYPGIRPFTKDEEVLFFGRSNEIEDLFNLINVNDVSVLFSQSGLGKSSLINAALIPRLIKEKMYPVYFRFLNSKDDPLQIIISEIKSLISKKVLESLPIEFQNNLWVLLNKWEHPNIPVLIFDQFEEFFYFEQAIKNVTSSALADLTKSNFPKNIFDEISEKQNEQYLYDLQRKPAVKLLFSLRSDRLSYLDEISTYIPTILSNRYKLKPLKIDKVEKAVVMPAQLNNRNNILFKTSPYEYSIESLEVIINTLKNKNDEVESTQLQIVCQELEQIAAAKNKNIEDNALEPDDFNGTDGIKEILDKFYETQIEKLRANKNLSLTDEEIEIIRNLIENELIVDNKRIIQSAEKVTNILSRIKSSIFSIGIKKKEEAIIDELLNLRLMREDDSHLGKVYEIGHDTLVPSIVKARDRRKEKELQKVTESIKTNNDLTLESLDKLKGRKYCFVIMGFGEKTDFATGRTLDLDKTYRLIIKKAVEASGLECIRADDIVYASVIDKPMYEHLLLADIVIADLSTSNANAIYELGIRHALKPRSTIVIAETQFKFPFDIGHLPIRKYEHLGKGIDGEYAYEMSQELRKAIINALNNTPEIDSPIYSYLPYLKPPTFDARAIKEIKQLGSALDKLSDSRKQWDSDISGDQSDIGRSESVLLEMFEQAKNNSNWAVAINYLGELTEKKPEKIYYKQQLALAIYKSKQPTVIDALQKAKELLATLNPKQTTDAETLALWGAVHKRFWDVETSKLETVTDAARSDLDEAIWAYEKGFYLKNDFYNGINTAYLLNVRALISKKRDAIADIVIAERIRKQVIDICHSTLGGRYEDGRSAFIEESEQKFWVQASLVEAYLGTNQKEQSDNLKTAIIAGNIYWTPAQWMIDTMNEQLDKLSKLLEKAPVVD